MGSSINLHLLYLEGVLFSEERSLQWLQRRNLLQNNGHCENCGENLKLVELSGMPVLEFRCPQCGLELEPLVLTNFVKFQVPDQPINILLAVMYYWCIGKLSSEKVSYLMNSTIDPGRIRRVYAYLRDLCFAKINERPTKLSGGAGVIIEVGIKSIGKIDDSRCIIGGLRRDEPNKIFLELLSSPTEEGVVDAVKRHVGKGAIILTDGFAFFDSLAQNGYGHQSSSIKLELTAGSIRHALWDVRRFLGAQKALMKNQQVPVYLAEYMWRRRFGKDPGQLFIETLRLLKRAD